MSECQFITHSYDGSEELLMEKINHEAVKEYRNSHCNGCNK